MNAFADLAKALGIGSAPWVIRAYITLLFACVALMTFATLQGASGANAAASQVLTLSIDSFKIVLGAVIGALSMAANQQWSRSATHDATVAGAAPARRNDDM